ncbi:hypothetical protein K458DRAFT_15092 [Lentithecium fluviatile CBS 122367]|uniref:Uncharacterized protein n=1 Tax=Lentithecium fluviatile CBS 122367 TaxID=1168545 RepID=A0A6G1J5X4_9PLEO|nr:hypothetical protein K458DRAFT_15092 [Lentithecium fluviatile CBS 122367]
MKDTASAGFGLLQVLYPKPPTHRTVVPPRSPYTQPSSIPQHRRTMQPYTLPTNPSHPPPQRLAAQQTYPQMRFA